MERKRKEGKSDAGEEKDTEKQRRIGLDEILLGARHVPYLSIPIINNMKTISTLLYVI